MFSWLVLHLQSSTPCALCTMPRSPSSPGWSIVDPASRDSSTLHKGAGSGPLPGDAEAPTPRATVTGVDLDLVRQCEAAQG